MSQCFVNNRNCGVFYLFFHFFYWQIIFNGILITSVNYFYQLGQNLISRNWLTDTCCCFSCSIQKHIQVICILVFPDFITAEGNFKVFTRCFLFKLKDTVCQFQIFQFHTVTGTCQFIGSGGGNITFFVITAVGFTAYADTNLRSYWKVKFYRKINVGFRRCKYNCIVCLLSSVIFSGWFCFWSFPAERTFYYFSLPDCLSACNCTVT